MKRFDLMHGINVRATFVTTQACLPYLKRSESGAIRTCSTSRRR